MLDIDSDRIMNRMPIMDLNAWLYTYDVKVF